MSILPTLKLLFFHICFYAVASKLRTPKDKTQQRSLRVFSPALDVTIADISVRHNNAKGYDANGCLDPSKLTQSKYYAQVQYEIRNSGDADFIAPAGSVNHAACGTPAILKFLSLKIEGGRDSSGNLYPAIELSRFATCVIDDSNTVDAASCVSGGPSTNFTLKPVKSLGISQGGSYGVSKKVSAKFPLTAEQFNALRNSLPSDLTFTLSVNKDISPNGAAGVVTAVDGSKLRDVPTWKATGQGTSVLLFMRPPSAAPSDAPSTVPSDSPSTLPSDSPSTAPSGSPSTVPSTSPSTAPSILPTAPTSAPTTYGLQLHYRFDSVSGSRVGNIASGSVVYDATLVNGAVVSNNQLLLSAASSQYMSSDPFTTGTAGLTFAIWYKSDNSGWWARIIDFGTGPDADNIVLAQWGVNDIISMHVFIPGGEINFQLDASYKFNTGNVWKHLVWTMDPAGSGTWKVYINGVQVGSAARAYPRSILRSKNYLGKDNWGGNGYLNGGIKDFRLYNRVLSAAEVSALFTSTNTN